MKKVAFCTLGCKVNHYETEAMAELFKSRGYTIGDFNAPADIYIINTCTVTSISDRKSRQMIRRAGKQNPGAVICVTGCYAQTAPEAVSAIEGVDLVVGTNERSRIVDLVESLIPGDTKTVVPDIMHIHEFEPLHISGYSELTRAYVKIQEGCNQFCSYCIIPYARGPIRSRQPADVLAEATTLAENGFSEIVFSGIHVASYGLDLGDISLAGLLSAANEISGLRRIRLSSIEPMTLNDTFIAKIRGCTKLCHHFHLSLQSGCDETLRRMNRKYTTAQYLSIVEGLRRNYPDVAVTTDIMVGFPGETEAEFADTIKFIEAVHFADAHIFQYSPRTGTPAAKYTNQVSPQIKEQRSKVITQIIQRHRREFLEGFIGQTMEVLFERSCGQGMFEGKTGNYITVIVQTPYDLSGKFRLVRLADIREDKVYGEIVAE